MKFLLYAVCGARLNEFQSLKKLVTRQAFLRGTPQLRIGPPPLPYWVRRSLIINNLEKEVVVNPHLWLRHPLFVADSSLNHFSIVFF